MEFVDFLMKVNTTQTPDQRAGQKAFNMLHDVRPDLASKVFRTELDPFYQDERLKSFWTWLMEHWNN